MDMKNRKGKRISEKEFKMLKELLDNGFSMKKVRFLTGRSEFTLGFIGKSGSYSEYLENVREYVNNQQRIPERLLVRKRPVGSSTESSDKSAEQLLALVAEMNRTLDDISALLKRWDAVEKFAKKGFFNIK